MMYTFYLNLVFFICYSYFHIPCLFSFIVSVSFFDFSFLFPSVFFFPPIFRPLLFFQKKTWRCSSTNKKVSKDGEQWESRNSCLHYRPRLDQYLIVLRARWRHQSLWNAFGMHAIYIHILNHVKCYDTIRDAKSFIKLIDPDLKRNNIKKKKLKIENIYKRRARDLIFT